MGVCACLGPQNGDPVCPCRMKSGGYSPDWLRFPELEKPRTFEQYEALPDGVYYVADQHNFYHRATKRGMGEVFWHKWVRRCSEFPTS